MDRERRNGQHFSRHLLVAVALLLSYAGCEPRMAGAQSGAQPAAAATQDTAPGVPFSAEHLNSLLPATVYFQGRSAPVQLRNAGGTHWADGSVVWAALVDSSGYSTAVQDRYQFYLVTEAPLRFGNKTLPAGAYGAGFQTDHFLLMDIGGHTLAEGPLQDDAALRRPRPLAVVAASPNSVRLYLGRHWVLLQAATALSAVPQP